MEQDKNANISLQHCRLGLAFAEDVFRRCCKIEITYLQQELGKAFEKNECIRETELDIRRMEGWYSSELSFQHSCHKKPACFEFLKRIADKLSTASKVNPYTLLMNISLQDCKDDDWKIAKLFLEPWMLECRGLEDLNAYCLLEMLGNLKIVNENDVAKTKKQSNITTLHQEHIDKMRKIAETFFLTENEQITKEDKCIFLRAIINLLAFEPGPDTDEVIQKIQDVMELEDSVTTGISLSRLTGCTAQSIDALMDKAENKDIALRIQKQKWFLQMRTDVISSLNRDPPMIIAHPVFDDSLRRQSTERDNIRDLLYYVEKNVGSGPNAKDTVQHMYKMALGTCTALPFNVCTKIQELFERQKQHRQLKELLLNESESTNFKTYFLGLLIMESVLRPYIERKITLIHTEVRHEFTRHKLCDVADKNDICRADGVVSDEVKFKHDCKVSPQCSKFLQCVLDKRPPKVKQKQYRMFKCVNPQDCLTNVWDFAKLFMDPWMHTNKGFEDLDVFCLLTLLENVHMFDANQSKLEALQQKVSKARYDALTFLLNVRKEMKYTMNVCLRDFIYILKEGIIPVADRAIQQLKDLIDNNKGHLFNIRLDREAKRQDCGQSLKKAGFYYWFKSSIAIKRLNPVFVDIVEGEINKLHEKTVNTFGPKPCPKATSDDICKSANNTAKFRHECPPKTLVKCQKLLDIIKEHTVETVPFWYMLEGTDPQIWLDSPFDYARIFLNKDSRGKRGFEDCDVTALCGIVKRCKPLINMLNKSLLKIIRKARNMTNHEGDIPISQHEMEDTFEDILEFLQYIKSLKDTCDAAAAIDCINQLQASDIRILFSGDEDSIQPSTSSMRERSGRGEQTRDEPTDRARGAKRALQETGSEEPVSMKKRKMAEHIQAMSEEQVRAVLMKTLDKDPDLMAEVFEEPTSI